MRKILLIVALMTVATFSGAMIKEAAAATQGLKSSASQNVSRRAGICAKIFSRCGDYCLTGTNEEAVNNCWSACLRGFELCEKVANSWPSALAPAVTGGNSGGNLKDFPVDGGGKLKAHAKPNAGGMSTMPGGATAAEPTASGPASRPAKPLSSSTLSKPAAGSGSGLLSRPGMPRLKAQ